MANSKAVLLARAEKVKSRRQAIVTSLKRLLHRGECFSARCLTSISLLQGCLSDTSARATRSIWFRHVGETQYRDVEQNFGPIDARETRTDIRWFHCAQLGSFLCPAWCQPLIVSGRRLPTKLIEPFSFVRFQLANIQRR
jgi:hypothetical protein